MSVYLQHFGLKCEPFSITPNPDFLYPSRHHRQAVAHLKYGLDREGGFILLTGEVGTGKTTLTRTLIKRMPPHVRVAYVLNGMLKIGDVLASICDELSIELPKTREVSYSKQCIDALNQDLLAAHSQGKKTLIVIEEAQNLSSDVLEALRLLSNLETNTHKLLHILLVGQPELLDILSQKELRQLNQRVVSRFHLCPLDKDDLSNYINHRLHRAGARGALFHHSCMPVLFRITKGVPRLINLVCQHSLLATYAEGKKTVTSDIVKKAAAEILGKPTVATRGRKKVAFLGSAALLLVVLGVGYATGGFDSVLKGPQVDSVQTVQDEIKSEPDFVEEVETPYTLTPYTLLLDAWGVEGTADTEEEFFSLASASSLRIEKITASELAELEKINRPGIIWLAEESGDLQRYLLAGIGQAKVMLQNQFGERELGLDTFNYNWSGGFLYLWRAPQGYVDALGEGSVNQLVVDWLQTQLNSFDNSEEIVITGGHYTPAIREKVERFQAQNALLVDGVLGRETVMAINQLSDPPAPRLLGGRN